MFSSCDKLQGKKRTDCLAGKRFRRAAVCGMAILLCLGGAAYAAEGGEGPQSGMDYFLAGGKLMWAILACSIIVLAFTLERVFALRRSQLVEGAVFEEIRLNAASGEMREAARSAQESQTPMGRVLSIVFMGAGSTRAEMETLVEDAGARELWQLQRNTRPLGIVSNIAPLLGLLGTVVGIIRAFSDVATQPDAIGNPQILATGIYEALITTAAGLSVAIPSYLLYHFFRGKAEAAIKDIEEKSLTLISIILHHRSGEPEKAQAASKQGDPEPDGKKLPINAGGQE